MKRLAGAVCITGLWMAISASPAPASVTIGQLATAFSPGGCSLNIDSDQPSVTSGTSYVVPADGAITSWSHNAGPGTDQQLTLKMFRKVADPAFYQVVGHDGPRPITPGILNTFPTSIAVKSGDVLGMNVLSPSATKCTFAAPGDSYRFYDGGLADGQAAAFDVAPDSRLNISAVFAPTSSVTLGQVTRNKKKGTAAISVKVPNPGALDLSGPGVAAISASAPAAGDVQLPITATGKKKKRLKKRGKVSLMPTVTFTPTGGDASAQTTNVALKKKKKH
jgi:hypothetical protein